MVGLHVMAEVHWKSVRDVRDTYGNPLKVGWAYRSDDNQVYTYIRTGGLDLNEHQLIWLVGGGMVAFDGRGHWESKTYTPICDLYSIMKVIDEKLLSINMSEARNE